MIARVRDMDMQGLSCWCVAQPVPGAGRHARQYRNRRGGTVAP